MSRIKINYQTNESHFIDGNKINPNNGTEIYQIINPSNEEALKKVVLDDLISVDSAISNSKSVYQSWSKMAMHKRIQILIKWYSWIKENKDSFVDLINLENGKPKSDAEAEFTRGLEVLQYAISLQPLVSGKYSIVIKL